MKWEYRVATRPTDDHIAGPIVNTEYWLNEMGLDGWELIIVDRSILTTVPDMWIFKRDRGYQIT